MWFIHTYSHTHIYIILPFNKWGLDKYIRQYISPAEIWFVQELLNFLTHPQFPTIPLRRNLKDGIFNEFYIPTWRKTDLFSHCVHLNYPECNKSCLTSDPESHFSLYYFSWIMLGSGEHVWFKPRHKVSQTQLLLDRRLWERNLWTHFLYHVKDLQALESMCGGSRVGKILWGCAIPDFSIPDLGLPYSVQFL